MKKNQIRLIKQMLAGTLAGLSLSCAANQNSPLGSVENFDSFSLNKAVENNVKASLIEGQEKKYGKALKLVFEPREESTIELPTPAQGYWNWDYAGDLNLALDVSNPGSQSFQFWLTLMDANGRKQERSAVIDAGQSARFYALLTGRVANAQTGMRETPPAWQTSEEKLAWRSGDRDFDFTKVTKIIFKAYAQFETNTLIVDNLELRVNPAQDPEYLVGIVDKFGQAAKKNYPTKIHSEKQLKAAADAELASLANAKQPEDRSRFGGWSKGPKLEGTGYFRTTKVDGRWWMVDPEGYLFFSSAIANVRMANLETITGYDFNDASVRKIDPEELTPEDSRDIIPVGKKSLNSRFLASPLRREMFEWLPPYDHELGEHYGYRRTVHQGVIEHGEVYSFYKANLERRYGQSSPNSYIKTWRDVTLDRMVDWGFTSFGNWIDPMFYDNQRMPFFANGWIIGDFKVIYSGQDYWSPLPDVYDPEFKRRAHLTIKQIGREVKNTPWCVGVFVDNEKGWGSMKNDRAHFGAVYYALSRTADESPAKKQFTQLLTKKYGVIAALNQAWGTKIDSWSSFATGITMDKLNDASRADFSMLYADYAETYFRIVSSEIKDALPNHMYMGVRIAAEWGMPVEVVAAAKKYSDVLSFNNYREGMHPDTWAFLKDLDFPTIIGEYHIGSTSDTDFYHPGLVIAADQTDRAKMYENYMNSVIDNPYMVGAHWFQYIDDPVTGRAYDGENYNVGWVSNTDIPYQPMVDAAKRVNKSLYQRRSKIPPIQ